MKVLEIARYNIPENRLLDQPDMRWRILDWGFDLKGHFL